MKTFLYAICLLLALAGNGRALEAKGVMVEELARTGLSWDGHELPHYLEGRPEVTILKITIPPQVELPLHMHPEINAGVLLKGELTVKTAEGKTLHLKAGDPIVEVVNTWHYGKNEGDVPAEIIVFYAGVQDEPITVKK